MTNINVRNQKGMVPVAVIALIVIVIGVAGFAGWRITQKDTASKDANNTGSSQTTVSDEDMQKVADACKDEINDEDVCKFFTSWGDIKQFSIVSTGNSDGVTTTSTIKIDGDKTYMKADGAIAYEVITIGDTMYTKSGDFWWKQTTPPTQSGQSSGVNADEFKYEAPTTEEIASNKTTYQKLGKEACGDLQCFKYKVVSSDEAESNEFIWFDDKDYLVRKTRSESAGGGYNEQIYSYENSAISEPSPVKELGANQYIVPGQSEPMTLPDMGQ